MLWSRVGLSSLAICGALAVSGVASAHYDDNSSYDNYSYSNGVYIAPVPASPMVRNGFHHCSMQHGYMHHASKHHHGYAYKGHMYRGYYVCKKYVYEVTPMHRDASCSDWKFEWMPVSRWHHSFKS